MDDPRSIFNGNRFFQKDPESWAVLKAELEICLKNSREQLEGAFCSNRDFFSGKVAAYKEILKLKEQYDRLIIGPDRGNDSRAE